MRVKIKELLPNPFRDLSSYPFNQEKIERLKQSIEATGFWDNILARQVSGQIQIAYGHHRLKALQEVYPPNYEIEVPIKDLSDELMLKIMANENMDEWGTSTSIVDETVKATRKFLGTFQENKVTAKLISEFLGWENWKVEYSYARINAIEKSGIDKKAIETIPSESAANSFTAAAKKANLTTGQQRRVAKRIAEEENYSPQAVKLAVEREANPPTKKAIKDEEKQKVLQFDEYLEDISKRANDLKNELVSLRRSKDAIRDYDYNLFENRLHFKLSFDGLQKSIVSTFKYLENE